MSKKKPETKNKPVGFLDRLAQNIALKGAVDLSRDANGKPDPYKAAGIAFGMGHNSPWEVSTLAGMLGAEGAFDPEPSELDSDTFWADTTPDFDSDPTLFRKMYPDAHEKILHDIQNKWRETCEDGSAYGISHTDYETEKEYQAALRQAKYGWRDKYPKEQSKHSIYASMFETEEEYLMAVSNAEQKALQEQQAIEAEKRAKEEEYQRKYGWRETCEDGSSYYISPKSYETLIEYEDALNAAKLRRRKRKEAEAKGDYDPFLVEGFYQMSSSELTSRYNKEMLAIDPANYPNQRQYKAACMLCDIRYGQASFFYANEKVETALRCKAILEDKDVLATRYLTVDGDFLIAQAVQENLHIPLPFTDEDEEQIASCHEVIGHIAKNDAQKALDVWSWILHTFCPFLDYTPFESLMCTYEGEQGESLPKGFDDLLLARLLTDDYMWKCLMPSLFCIGAVVHHYISVGNMDEAKKRFSQAISSSPPNKYHDLVAEMVKRCNNEEEIESLEFVRDTLLPIAEEAQSKTRYSYADNYAKVREYIGIHITHVELKSPKYAFSRRFAWRAACQDGKPYGVDPLDYLTVEDYDKAIEKKKKASERTWKADWKHRMAAQARLLHLDVADYANETAYIEAANEAIRKLTSSPKDNLREQTTNTPNLSAPPTIDEDVYYFCGVLFPGNDKVYHYLTEDPNLQIGDIVSVPSRNIHGATEVMVVSIGVYTEEAAPYPVEAATYILGKIDED